MEGDPERLLPHRAPILCIDRFVETAPDRAAAELVVRSGPHVADDTLWTQSLIEGMAQTAAGLRAEADDRSVGKGMLVGLADVELRRCPRLGERVTFTAELVRRFGAMLRVRAAASAGAEVLASAELTFYSEHS